MGRQKDRITQYAIRNTQYAPTVFSLDYNPFIASLLYDPNLKNPSVSEQIRGFETLVSQVQEDC